ncbi:hypothetical protein PV08_07034 [Exophiala spinifera]|uniref:Zn(2)-C6 fungal-type domain-containing protein n=1 Tax=Exophiala spinifera TaxID=91928 RepID=A0A0D1ZN27_9EURO|nr:uncharacterized protein PV08_07034 [Exophiala spinifera]KIW14252.1 hypothetical protein PV08_07034 [Exophiala spinifera]
MSSTANEIVEPKARKACINCRRQKMKCRPGDDSACRRCLRAGVPCIFVPRANAAGIGIPSIQPTTTETTLGFSILHRLQKIEDLLGISESATPDDASDAVSNGDPDVLPQNTFWNAVAVLRNLAPARVTPAVWERGTIMSLWSSFHERMPGLHFMPSRQVFTSPCPLLLSSMLYCSSIRGPDDISRLAPQYFTVLCRAMAQLSIPDSKVSQVPRQASAAEEWAFQTILAIVLAGLLCEATTRETGIWIAIAYRLMLDHCPPWVDERSREWRKLFSGVQIVDLEHASIHLACPVIPASAPLQKLQAPASDQLSRLSRIMHAGLTHFTGRGLPTIWSCFALEPSRLDSSGLTFSGTDAAVIRDWARQLDDWLVEFSGSNQDSPEDRALVFRQYILHRLMVLSIYHPARGCNLYSRTMSPRDQSELLLSARAALQLHANDKTIWSNWDLVMISWAALIVTQGLEAGFGQENDLEHIKNHIGVLRQIHEPVPGLRARLIARLEPGLEQINFRDAQFQQQHTQAENIPLAFDSSWEIFDQNSLQQLALPSWSVSGQMLPLT